MWCAERPPPSASSTPYKARRERPPRAPKERLYPGAIGRARGRPSTDDSKDRVRADKYPRDDCHAATGRARMRVAESDAQGLGAQITGEAEALVPRSGGP